MFLDKPAFPVSFTPDKVVALIEELIKSRGWSDFEVAEIKLVYTPYWTFNFDSCEHSGSKIRGVKSGALALNALTNRLEDFAGFLSENPDLKTTQHISADYEADVQHAKTSMEEAREIAKLKLAANLRAPKDNIILSGLELLYIPFWLAYVSVAEGTFKLRINAVIGEIVNQEEVPEREKGWLEVTNETLDELKEPMAWVSYTRQVGSGALSFLFSNPLTAAIFRELKTNRSLRTAILAIIAILVVLRVMGFI